MRAAGLELGRDVSLIAHDDDFPFLNADRMVPPMSTTRSSIRAAGTRVAEIAIDLLAGRSPETVQELWPVDLVIRGSTGPAPPASAPPRLDERLSFRDKLAPGSSRRPAPCKDPSPDDQAPSRPAP